MAIKSHTHSRVTKFHFLAAFWAVAAVLYGVKCAFPELAGRHLSEVREFIERPLAHHRLPSDSISRASRHVDSLLLRPRRPIALLDDFGEPVAHRVKSVPSFKDAFPDLNDVQLATAERLGVPECDSREEAASRLDQYVCVGESPYFDMERLTHSVPYLVPRAAILLDEIGRNFLDSLAVKGIPFHKMVVTSLLRTNDDIRRLRRHNGNASEQSCHRFGTTFDISYNIFHRVQDPDLPPQPETWAVTLKSVLAEVLDDLRRNGACYVKYEYRQSCFHITCR